MCTSLSLEELSVQLRTFVVVYLSVPLLFGLLLLFAFLWISVDELGQTDVQNQVAFAFQTQAYCKASLLSCC